MLSKTFTTATLALAASSLVSAQTFTDCNPLKTDCPADPAYGKNKVTCDFTKGACDAFDVLPGTTLKYGNQGAVFTINKDSDAPTIRSKKYIFFGRIDVEVQAAQGKGIVTSAVLQSDDLDEIDWEWVGGDNAQVQTNYFSKGDTSTYDRGAYHPVSNPTGSTHTYSVEWTSTAITWMIDGQTVRTLTAASTKGGTYYPQTPMQIKLGTWDAGRKGAPEGTAQWAGGYTDFSQAPFIGYYKSISITDYAGGNGPSDKSVKEYVYGDKSGSWESIKVEQGDSSSDSSSSSSSSSATGTSTKTGSVTATGTTMSTAAATGSNSTVTKSSPSSTSTAVPGNSGSRGAVAVGSLFLAGAGAVLANLFL